MICETRTRHGLTWFSVGPEDETRPLARPTGTLYPLRDALRAARQYDLEAAVVLVEQSGNRYPWPDPSRPSSSDSGATHTFEELQPPSRARAPHSKGTHRRLRPQAANPSYRIVLKREGDSLDGTGGWFAVLYRGEVVIDVLPGRHSRQIQAKLTAHEAWGWHIGVRYGVNNPCPASATSPTFELARTTDAPVHLSRTSQEPIALQLEGEPRESGERQVEPHEAELTIQIKENLAGRGRTRFVIRLQEDARTREKLRGTFATFGEALRAATKQYGANVPVIDIATSGEQRPWPGPTYPSSRNTDGGRLLRERLVAGPVTLVPPDVAAAIKRNPFPLPLVDDYRDGTWSYGDLACYCAPPRTITLDIIDFDAFDFYCRRCRRWLDSAGLRGVTQTLRGLA